MVQNNNIKNFFEKLFPKELSNNYVTISLKNANTNQFINKSFKIDKLDEIVEYCISNNGLCHIYFGVGLLSDQTYGNARANNDAVACIPGFWMDIDYGKDGHSSKDLPPTKEDALSLLNNTPEPSIIISTGGGLHAYWLFHQPILINNENRISVSDSLRSFQNDIIKRGNDHGWKVDNTANLAQLLRVPETINHKYKKSAAVESMLDNRYTMDDLCKSFSNDNTSSIHDVDHSENAKDIIASYDIDIDDLRTITEYFFLKSGCKWIEYCESNSRNLYEPEWHAMLSIVSRIEDGKQHCHEISRNYKNYSYPETEDKILQTLSKGSPCKCNYIESKFHNKTCEKCILKKIIKSPIELCKKNAFNLNREKFIEFNSKHAAISIAGKSLVINYNETDQQSKLKTFSLSSYDDFNKRYLPLHGKTINKKGEIVADEKFTKIWLNSNYRKDFPNGIVFSPNDDVEGAYNLWQGFQFIPQESGDWSLFKNHIMEVVCDNKPEIYNYLIAWMANIVQNLGEKRPGTAIVLRGERGTGKSIFADIFGKVFGGHYMTVTQKNHLVGKFNNHLCNKVLVFADEAIYSGDKESNEILKTLITGNTLTVEKKGIDAVVVPNNISLIIAGNNNELVNAGTSERRYLVLELSNIHKQDHQYFEDMIKQMENGGYEKMLYDLQNYDIDCVNLRNVPKTACLFDQLLGAWHDKPVQRFIFEYLTENVSFAEENNHEIKTSALYDDFTNWTNKNKAKVVDKSNFQKTFNKYIGSKLITKGSNKEKFAILTSLDEGRKHFQNVIGMDIPWNDYM